MRGTARRRGALAALAVVAAVAGACGGAGGGSAGGDGRSTGTGPGPVMSTTASSPPAAVPEKLQFTSASVDGGQVAGAAYAGQDVVLWFWAPW